MRILEKKNKKVFEPYVVISEPRKNLCDWAVICRGMNCDLCIANRRDRKERLTKEEAVEIWKEAEYPLEPEDK